MFKSLPSGPQGLFVEFAEGFDPSEARRIEKDLGIVGLNPAADLKPADGGFVLRFAKRAEPVLYSVASPDQQVSTDFVGGEFFYRLKTSGKNQPLTKALGVPKGVVDIVDLSAGFGQDAFVLAWVGCRVRLVERQPLLAQMLVEALRVASKAPSEVPRDQAEKLRLAAERMTVVRVDALSYLGGLSDSERPEAIYFDPMYPETGRKALPRKEMQLLEKLVGADEDQAAVGELALKTAKNRLVVKRPRQAPPLLGLPTQSFESPTTRYDLYLSK